MEDDLEKIGDQVKEFMGDMFQHMTQQQEEMNGKMQEQVAKLCQMLEAARITPS
jgi:polyhydroxyalkanoate synthesis regulator phasin